MIMDKKEHILAVAEDLFAEFGYEGTSVRELAKKSGVNVAMISYYFGSKEQLMESLITSRSGYLKEKLEMISDEAYDPETKISLLVDFYVHRILDMNKFHKILHREMSLQQRSKFNKTISTIFLKNKEKVRAMIEEGQRKKVFRKIDIELTMATIVGTISHVILSSQFTCKLLDLDPKSDGIFSDELRNRLKDHLKSLLKAHLMRPAKIS